MEKKKSGINKTGFVSGCAHLLKHIFFFDNKNPALTTNYHKFPCQNHIFLFFKNQNDAHMNSCCRKGVYMVIWVHWKTNTFLIIDHSWPLNFAPKEARPWQRRISLSKTEKDHFLSLQIYLYAWRVWRIFLWIAFCSRYYRWHLTNTWFNKTKKHAVK